VVAYQPILLAGSNSCTVLWMAVPEVAQSKVTPGPSTPPGSLTVTLVPLEYQSGHAAARIRRSQMTSRRARVSQSLFLTDRTAVALMEPGDGESGLREGAGQMEMIYDGANAYLRHADGWTGISLADPGGPLGPYDPLWPLDALFGASDDAVEIGPVAVRGVPTTRYRLTVDLGRADAALPAGVSVPPGPYRALSQMPAEVWLDSAGLARRISVSSEPATTADKQVWSIVELWDFGVTADITPPGPDEVLTPAGASRAAEEEPPRRNA
jgi:hypothetical protein